MAEVDDINVSLQKYVDRWTEVQIEIWQERIERLEVIRTGALHESFTQQIRHTAAGSTIMMRFLEYGIFQARGTGNGYRRGNPGDLDILDEEYREKHGLNKCRRAGSRDNAYLTSGKPRDKKRDWFSGKLWKGTRVMVEDIARITGDEAARVVVNCMESG